MWVTRRDGIRLGHCSQQDAVSGRVCIGGEVKAQGYFDVAAAAAARDDHARNHDHLDLARKPLDKGPASQPAAAVVELHQDEPSADSWTLQAAPQSRQPEPGRAAQPQPQVQVQVQFQFQVRVQVQVQGSGLRRGIDESGQLAVARPPPTRAALACLVTSCPVRPVCTDTRRPTTPRQCNHCQPPAPESQPKWSQQQQQQCYYHHHQHRQRQARSRRRPAQGPAETRFYFGGCWQWQWDGHNQGLVSDCYCSSCYCYCSSSCYFPGQATARPADRGLPLVLSIFPLASAREGQ